MATRKNAVRDNRKRVWSNLYRFGACIYVTPRWVFTIAADVRFSEVSLQDLALPGPVPEKRPSRHLSGTRPIHAGPIRRGAGHIFALNALQLERSGDPGAYGPQSPTLVTG